MPSLTDLVDLNLADSPVRIARLDAGYTIEGAAKRADVSWHAWYNTECGMYAGIPPSIMETLVTWSFDRDDLQAQYKAHQTRKRQNFGRIHWYLTVKELPAPSKAIQPFRQFREKCLRVSRSRVAKALCVQVAVLYKLETGKNRSMPQQLREAMLEAGFVPTLIDELDDRCIEHYEGLGNSKGNNSKEKDNGKAA